MRLQGRYLCEIVTVQKTKNKRLVLTKKPISVVKSLVLHILFTVHCSAIKLQKCKTHCSAEL